MNDRYKLKSELISELTKVRRKASRLERALARQKSSDMLRRQSEEKFRTLVESSPQVIITVDETGKIALVNDRIAEIFGYSKDELIGRQIEDLVPENLQSLHADYRQGYMREPRTRKMGENLDLVALRKDGSSFPVEIGLSYIKNQKSGVLALAFISDISRRKQAENELRVAKDTAQMYLDIAGVILVAIDANKKVKLINKKGCELLGYSHKEIIESNWFDNYLPARVKSEIESFFEQFIAGRLHPAESYENPILTRDGRERLISWHNTIITDENNNVVGTLSSGEDITERKRAETNLQKSEQRYQELFNSIMEGVGLVDADETIIFCNPAYAEIFEEDGVEQIVGKSLFDYVPAHQLEKLSAETKKRKMGLNSQYELEIATAKKNKRTILLSASPRFDSDKKFIGSFGAFMDITETKKLQEEISRAQRLEAAGRIAGQVAHDFNNLLGPLVAYPDVIKRELPPDHPLLPLLDDAQKAAEQLAEINQQLLTLGRRGYYQIQPLNLNELISRSISQLEPIPATLSVELKLADDILTIKGGRSQIQRVVMNLLTNARDAMNNLGKLSIKTENFRLDRITGVYSRIPRGEYVKLTISDTGHGIDRETIGKIFEPFFTTKTADRKRGSGLGLSIVHSVLQDHHGYIDLKSEPGTGTSFYIYFPASRDISNLQMTGDVIGNS